MLFETKGLRVFVYSSVIDMRAGFERLAYFVREHLRGQIDQGHVYLFFGKNRRRLKAIYFDGSGLVLVAKRIERGNFMSLMELDGRSEITVQDLRLIFHGSVIRRPSLQRSMTRVETSLPRGSEVGSDHARP